MQLRTSCMLVLGTLLTMATQAQKRKKNTPISLTTTGMACCIEEAEALPNSANTDALFAATATTAAFGKLHQEPLPFTLAAPKGAMQMFNCADGVPGMAYTIPAADASMNFLIVIQEWWGLNDHIKQEAERFYEALGGKVHVLAVDLYDGKVAASVDSAQKLIGAALQSKRKEAILMGAMDYAGKGANIYTVGWCFGGMMSLQTAIMGGSRVRGAVMYYGTPEKNTAQIAKIQCPVLGIFGTQDRSIPNETVDQFAAAMQAAGKTFILHRYEAGHAFANPSNPGYNRQFGDDAFDKAVAFLKERMR